MVSDDIEGPAPIQILKISSIVVAPSLITFCHVLYPLKNRLRVTVVRDGVVVEQFVGVGWIGSCFGIVPDVRCLKAILSVKSASCSQICLIAVT